MYANLTHVDAMLDFWKLKLGGSSVSSQLFDEQQSPWINKQIEQID